MKSNVLFVDDQTNVLSGLRRMLRGMRVDWEMAFADSGEKALKLMRDQEFDVIVSDMRMPEMDGAALLEEVRRRHPRSVRIILSGYSEEEAVLRTVGPAHQYLAKPCDAAVIVETIHRALNLRRFLNNEGVLELVSGLDHLPSPPESFSRLLNLLDSPRSNVTEIADAIAGDLAMTAQTLKLTNSAYFALTQKVDDLHQAVNLLGTDTLKQLVLIAGIYVQYSGDARIAAQIETLSQRCWSIGAMARKIALMEGLSADQIDQATSSGVLAHIGTLVLLANWPERFGEAVKLVKAGNADIVEAERQIFGAAHPEIGAYLLGLWGFTDPIAETVAFHHAPWQCPSVEKPMVLICVYAAQQLLKAVDGSGENTVDPLKGTGMDMDYLEKLGLDDRVPDWIELARKLKMKAEEGEDGQ